VAGQLVTLAGQRLASCIQLVGRPVRQAAGQMASQPAKHLVVWPADHPACWLAGQPGWSSSWPGLKDPRILDRRFEKSTNIKP
jgi:hypothetical protein